MTFVPPAVMWGGFSIWPGPAGRVVDFDLAAYVDAGAPPVIVTLSTSAAAAAD